MTVKIFLPASFKECFKDEQIDLLVARFREYKSTGIKHVTFGRDSEYTFPPNVVAAELKHIHIKDGTSRNWHLKKIDFHMTSNTALVYCEGYFHKNYYCLLGFSATAHETFNSSYLSFLAREAEKFRGKF